ncbi:MAG: hypothetical protein OEU84_15480, partial [Xanthomonadales bacterium]|nr:hypothetical protein [Xanthomonadales bacterium]
MIRSTIFAVLLCSFATISSGNEPTTDARESGQLSYTLFNLTGEAWVVTPYGPQGNPHAYTDLAYTWGWQGGESKSVEKTTNPPNIFNYYPFDTPKNDDCRLENPNQFTWVKDSYIFFNEQADPLYYKTGYSDCNSDSPSQFFEGTETIKKGIEGRFCSKSGHWLLDDGSGKIQGRPAVADSFWLAPAGFSDRGILFSSLASSANMFYSFQQGSYKSRWEDANYPQCVSRTGHFPNEEINPLAPDPEYRALGSGMVNADFAI